MHKLIIIQIIIIQRFEKRERKREKEDNKIKNS